VVASYLLRSVVRWSIVACCRPLNRILVAQKISKPQAVVSFVCTLLHLLINWLFVEAWGWGPAAVAWANSLASTVLSMMDRPVVAFMVLESQELCSLLQPPRCI